MLPGSLDNPPLFGRPNMGSGELATLSDHVHKPEMRRLKNERFSLQMITTICYFISICSKTSAICSNHTTSELTNYISHVNAMHSVLNRIPTELKASYHTAV